MRQIIRQYSILSRHQQQQQQLWRVGRHFLLSSEFTSAQSGPTQSLEDLSIALQKLKDLLRWLLPITFKCKSDQEYCQCRLQLSSTNTLVLHMLKIIVFILFHFSFFILFIFL